MSNLFQKAFPACLLLGLILSAAVLGALSLRGAGHAPLVREIHLIEDSSYGETAALMRLPLAVSFARAQDDPHGFLIRDDTAGVSQILLDQTAYEDNFDGFLHHLLKDITFSASGEDLPVELGLLSMVAITGTEPLPPGLVTTQSLLGVCAAFPERAEISNIEVVLQVYLPGTSATDRISISIAALPPGIEAETRITDHRGVAPVIHGLTGVAARRIDLPGRDS